MGSRMQKRDEILTLFRDNNESKVVLIGDAGMGKTWLAREISKAISECAGSGGSYCRTIWLSLNRKYEERSICETVAHQLSLFSEFEECEDDDKEEKEEEKLENLRRRIADELERIRGRAQYLLLILDDEGCKTSEEEVMTALDLRTFLTEKPGFLKVLITKRKGDESSTNKIALEPLSEDDLLAILSLNINEKIMVLSEEDKKNIARKSMGLPAATIVLAKSLNHITLNGSKNLSPAQTRALKELAFVANEVAGSYNPVLQLAYDMLKIDETVTSATLHCFWHSLDVFESCGCICYRDLITHWILEGYFDPVRCVKRAYREGHNVLMELMKRGMLKIQEDNVVVPEVEMRGLVDLRRRGFFEKTSLGLVRAFRSDKRRSLGKICQIDDMIKTLTTKTKGEKVSTILINGNRLRRENSKNFFEEMQDLEILGLFDPVFSLVPFLSKLKKLRVLVIRDCYLLERIKELSNLQGLHALEISGASCLAEIPDEFFNTMSQLQCLNLSRLRINSLPSNLSELSELRCLILRDCPCLEDLPNIQSLVNLEVVDVCGASSLTGSKDGNTNKNFGCLQKLQTLDFSDSQIDRLPIFRVAKKFETLHSLTRLLLKNCTKLLRLPHLKPLSGLQILDLSGAVHLQEIIETAFENKKELKIFDLSGTAIGELPPGIAKLSDLRHLLLKGCSNLKILPDIGGLTKLEALNVSGCSNLTKIEGSFENMSHLQELNLSSTKVKSLPALPNFNSIRRLILKDCSSLERLLELEGFTNLEVLELSGCLKLEALPKLDACKKLEVLDLSGCSELKTIHGSFEHLSSLQKLNLSGTKIERVPAFCRSSNLSYLSIRNCAQLESLSSIGVASNLQELDLGDLDRLKDNVAQTLLPSNLKNLNLSGIYLTDLSFISHLTSLNQLSLAIAGGVGVDQFLKYLGSLTCLEVLSVSGLGTMESLYEVPKLKSLKRIILPDLNITQEIDWSRMEGMAKELSFEKFGLSVPTEIPLLSDKPPLLATGQKAFELFKKPELCSEELHISMCFEDQVTSTAISCQGDIFGYEDIYFKTRAFDDQHRKLLEIHGSYDSSGFPDHVKNALAEAKYVSFIDNLSDSGLQILKGFCISAARGLWLDRCMEMKNVFSDENENDITSWVITLETLWLSNLPKLETLCSGNLQPDSFKNLKKLSLDCCPKLKTIFSAPQRLTSLEILHIKFCNQLKEVFEAECELPKLRTLILVGLPKLSAVFSTSQPLTSLEILQIKFCDQLKKVFEVECELPKLKTLILVGLPELSSVGAKLPWPRKIINCPKLKDTEESVEGGSTSQEIEGGSCSS